MAQERNDSPEAAGYVKADDIRVRIEDGQVQWYDGRSWHEVSSAKDLEQEDRFCLAQESFRAFDRQLRQEKGKAAGRGCRAFGGIVRRGERDSKTCEQTCCAPGACGNARAGDTAGDSACGQWRRREPGISASGGSAPCGYPDTCTGNPACGYGRRRYGRR